MLIAITAKAEIAQCQRLLVRGLRRHLPRTERLLIGYPGGSDYRYVSYRDDLWFSSVQLRDEPVPRYWNGFGTGKRPSGQQIISVEINSPVTGYTEQLSGVYARDNDTGKHFVLHRGRVRGVDKQTFRDWYRGRWVDVAGPSGRSAEAILVGGLDSSRLADEITLFVSQVAEFKNQFAAGRLARKPIHADTQKDFSPESYGTRKSAPRTIILEYESMHGLIVNQLEKWINARLNGKTVNAFNNRFVDLGIEVEGRLRHVFEVKSSADLQSIYTAVGQLMMHSRGSSRITRTIVLPVGQLAPRTRNVLAALKVRIIEYAIEAKNVAFSE